MKESEVKKLIGEVVVYKSNRTRQSIFPKACGCIGHVVKDEVYLNGDWHDIKTLEIIEVL